MERGPQWLIYQARAQAHPSLDALEIGSDYGETTSILSQFCRSAVGIDKSSSHVEEARKRHPHIQFVCADVLTDMHCLEKQRRRAVSLCLIDINGNRELETVQKCLERVISLVKPRVIVVKSQKMYDEAVSRTNA